MDIVIVSQYLRNIEDFDGNNSRFVYLAKLLEGAHDVEIITSDFLHGTKTHAQKVGELGSIKVSMIHEPGYPQNVCLKRFYSHNQLAKGISKYLDERKKPDVCYCAIPSLDVAYLVAQYCKKNDVKFIVDVQDLWPEAFKMVFNLPIISDLIFKPMNVLANKIYMQADEIIAVSDIYVERALSVNKKVTKGHSVFLGTKLEDFDANVKSFDIDKINITLPIKKVSDLWLGYCGTLGSSYDLICVFDALERIKKQGIEPPFFIVMGDGPQKQEFEEYAIKKSLNVIFTGRLAYVQMCGLLCMCDMVVNPIMSGSAATIINKHGDYAASGLPVLNTQECEEYRSLVENYNMGFNCNNNDAVDLAEKMMRLIKDKQLREEMGINARRCAEERFDRSFSYEVIKKLIEQKV